MKLSLCAILAAFAAPLPSAVAQASCFTNTFSILLAQLTDLRTTSSAERKVYRICDNVEYVSQNLFAVRSLLHPVITFSLFSL